MPSEFQEAILQNVQDGERAIAVLAVPGAGKSTTIVEAAARLPAESSIALLSFNRHSKDELQKKVNDLKKRKNINAKCRTIHSIGNDALCIAYEKIRTRFIRKKGNDDEKYSKICKAYLKSCRIRDKGIQASITALVRRVRLAVSREPGEKDLWLCKIIRDKITEYQAKHEQDPKNWPGINPALSAILNEGIRQATEEGIIDFTDMLWLPVEMNLPVPQYDNVFIDEAQDLSPLQLALVLKAWNGNGTFVAVGDRHQSIYAFAGASLRSVDEIIEATGAIEMGLSICYRCPLLVVELAAGIYPGITPAPHVGLPTFLPPVFPAKDLEG